MNVEDTKYSRIEYERRFLVRATAAWRGAVRPGSKRIEDKYLHGTRLRLRAVTDTASNERTLKLTKKSDSPSVYFRTISRILLSNDELRVFDALPGDRLTKTRHHVLHLDRVFAVDVFDGLLEGLILCEVEASSLDDVMCTSPPAFVHCEVTEDPFFSGANLSRLARDDLLAKLASLGAC
jgi:CYTH domain-containing protein